MQTRRGGSANPAPVTPTANVGKRRMISFTCLKRSIDRLVEGQDAINEPALRLDLGGKTLSFDTKAELKDKSEVSALLQTSFEQHNQKLNIHYVDGAFSHGPAAGPGGLPGGKVCVWWSGWS